MYRYILCLTALLGLCFLPLKAQEIEVSETIELGRDAGYRLIAQYDTTLLILREAQPRHQIEAYGLALQKLWNKEIEYPKNIVEVLQLVSDKNYFTIIYAMNRQGKTEVRARRMAPDASELSDVLIYGFSTAIPFNYFTTEISEDKQQLLVYVVKTENHLDWASFDLGKMTLHWAKEGSLPKINYLRDFSQLLINNAGEVFLVLEYHNNKRKRHQHHFLVHRLSPNGQLLEFKIPLANYLSYDQLFVYDELNKQLVVGGLYAENAFNANGLYYLRYNFIDTPYLHTTPFSDTFIRSLTGEKRKKLDGISNLDINDIILRRDGGMIFIAEQNFKYEYQLTSSYYNDTSPGRQADYLYENILMASIHPDGNLHWKQVLYKSQSSENDEGRYSSFFLMKTPTNLRLLYNDDTRWSSSIFEYVINGKGEAERNRLFEKLDKEESGVIPEFRKAIQVAANVMVAGSIRNNKLKIVKITY